MIPKLNEKQFKVRTKTFKPYRVKAISLFLKYEQFIKGYDVSDTNAIAKALFQGKITKEDLENRTEAFYDIVHEMIYDNKPVRELFLLENGKELCDVVFEDCNIEHRDEWESGEYDTYMTFLQEVLSFFLMTSKKLTSSKKTIENSEQISQATPITEA